MRSWTVYEKVRPPDIKCRAYPTLPLALSPVNQIVIPFCCRRFTLSSLLTDPGKSISDRALVGMGWTGSNQDGM